MPITMIWAQARHGVIGDGADMPWHIPEDLAYFKTMTAGRPCIMGRATWDSLPPRFRPLPNRRNIVCTRDSSWSASGAEAVASLTQALDLAGSDAVISGGGQIYALALPVADECLITEIDAEALGRVRAPALTTEWRCAEVGGWISDPRSRVQGVDGMVRHRHTVWRRI